MAGEKHETEHARITRLESQVADLCESVATLARHLEGDGDGRRSVAIGPAVEARNSVTLELPAFGPASQYRVTR